MLRTEGTKVLDANGNPIRLVGVNRAGLEWESNDNEILTSVQQACDDWNCNVIRLPVSQDRWFGFAPEQQARDVMGEKYRKTVDTILETLTQRGKYLILDMHWSNNNEWGQNIGQHPMPDLNTVLFWKDAATRYRNHPNILFNPYNEPYGVSWDVWKDGGEVTERVRGGDTRTYITPGTQKIVDVIRATGAKNIIVIGGLDWAFTLEEICNGYEIDDRGGNGIIYDTHVYPWKPLDWDKYVAACAAKYPILVGEFGHYGDHAKPREGAQALPHHEWMTKIIEWIDKNQFHFTAWDFHPKAGPCLIKSFDNEPTEFFGVYVKEYLAKSAEVR